MNRFHAVIWIDHHEARVFFFDRDSVEEIDLASRNPNSHLHHRKGSMTGKRAAEDQGFYHDVVEAMRPAQEWLIMGPGSAKLELVKYVHKHAAQLNDRIVGIETADHPTDRQIVAHARSYFKAADAKRPQI